MTKLEELLDSADKQACLNFAQDGHLVPVWLLQSDDTLFVVLTDLDNKDAEAGAIRHLIAEKNVVRFVLVREAWIKSFKDEPQGFKLPEGSIEHMPGRLEAVILTGEDRQTNESILRVREILRPADGKPTLGKPDDTIQHAKSLGGRFQNMFEPELSDTTH